MDNYKRLLKDITTFVFDYDGIFTDGNVILKTDDEPLRTINTKDAYAVQLARKMDFRIVVITGGKSQSVEMVLKRLGVTDIYMRARNKKETLEEFFFSHKINPDNVLFMGDDIPDYKAMTKVCLPCSPLDAVEEIKAISKYISPKKGGEGCVRDVIEQVLKIQGKWMNDIGFVW